MEKIIPILDKKDHQSKLARTEVLTIGTGLSQWRDDFETSREPLEKCENIPSIPCWGRLTLDLTTPSTMRRVTNVHKNGRLKSFEIENGERLISIETIRNSNPEHTIYFDYFDWKLPESCLEIK